MTVKVPEYYLTSYDALGTGAYILNDGTYYFTAASDSHEAVNNILAKAEQYYDKWYEDAKATAGIDLSYDDEGNAITD